MSDTIEITGGNLTAREAAAKFAEERGLTIDRQYSLSTKGFPWYFRIVETGTWYVAGSGVAVGRRGWQVAVSEGVH